MGGSGVGVGVAVWVSGGFNVYSQPDRKISPNIKFKLKKERKLEKMLQGKHKRQSPGLYMCLMQVGMEDRVYGCTLQIKKS